MSRVAKAPVAIPAGVEVTLNGQEIVLKVRTAPWKRSMNAAVEITERRERPEVCPSRWYVTGADAQAGTARALVNNMVNWCYRWF